MNTEEIASRLEAECEEARQQANEWREAISRIEKPHAGHFEHHPAFDQLAEIISLFAHYPEKDAKAMASQFLLHLSRDDSGAILFKNAGPEQAHKGLDFIRARMKAASISGDDIGAVSALYQHDAFAHLFALTWDDVIGKLPLAVLIREGVA